MQIEAHTMQSRVSEFEPGCAWYEKLLGRGPTFIPPGGGIAEWELYPGCWLVVLQAEPDPGDECLADDLVF